MRINQRQGIIFDFDGTLSDSEQEAKPFVVRYFADLATHLKQNKGISSSAFAAALQAAQALYGSVPEAHPWDYAGKIVAPSSDPYVRTQAIAGIVFDQFGLYQAAAKRTDLLNDLFKANYSYSAIVFREGAKELLEEAVARMPVAIITNSDKTVVQHKIDVLNPRGKEKILLLGNARKYLVETGWSSVPEMETVPGLERLVYVWRPHYAYGLARVEDYFDLPLQCFSVMGDIYDLDLALPKHLGVRQTILMAKEGVQEYEKQAANHVVQGIADAHKIIFS